MFISAEDLPLLIRVGKFVSVRLNHIVNNVNLLTVDYSESTIVTNTQQLIASLYLLISMQDVNCSGSTHKK